ncbi:hypothetical protein ARALYDRAFT_911904 [Arabidopsis lyrata subsp. lyrata]|uniref:Uncharacterized protein n=1 Tax=Arabidopsis lyrata subsp. lyrata TaxID=81972 RepID=D7M3B3_ARALL|nr:hypothetical protein ARALYDRAFT_911904 [Arabidopsis lyrata subsp. lyrata]
MVGKLAIASGCFKRYTHKFFLLKEFVLKLKVKANNEAGFEDGKISSLQAVLGHIWRSRVKNSGMSREEDTHCRLPIDMSHLKASRSG